MEIEIAIAGESSKWLLSQQYIRIGQDPRCEVNLSGGRYPAVAGEHTALEVADGAVQIVKGSRPGAETFLNGRPASDGSVLRSGDVLRLGVAGPELRIRLLETEAAARFPQHEPTRMINQPAVGATVHEPTRIVNPPAAAPSTHEPTRMIPSPAAASLAPPQPPPASAPARQSFAAPTVASAYTPPAAAPLPRRPEAVAPAGAAQASHGPSRGLESNLQRNAAKAAAAHAAEGGSMQTLEAKLNTMRTILVVNLVVVLALLVFVFLQGRELTQTHREVQELRAQAQSAVGTFTPSLDARLNVFEKRMDGMDAKVASAQDRMVKGMDEQAKAAEDHLVERMNTEIPAMMDKYVAKTKADLMQH